MFVFYNDLNVASVLFLLITSLIMIIDKKCKLPFKFLLFTLTLILLINIKASAFGYAGIYSMVFFIYILLNKTQRKINLKKIIISGVVGVILGVFIVGASTYVKNTIDHGHPFYPIYGKEKIDVIIGQIPFGFYELNRFEKFFVANFSKMTNINGESGREPELKIPFQVFSEELNEYSFNDIRFSGYGALFSGILLVSTILLGYFLIFKRGKNKELFWFVSLPIISMILIIILVSDTWWARYFPQLYLMPIFALIYLKVFNTKIMKVLKYFLLIFLLINISLFIIKSVNLNYQETKSLYNIVGNYKTLKESNDYILIDSTIYQGYTYNFYDIDKDLVHITKETNKEELDLCLYYYNFIQVY